MSSLRGLNRSECDRRYERGKHLRVGRPAAPNSKASCGTRIAEAMRAPVDSQEAIHMSIRKGAPWLAAFAILGVGSVAFAGHFGATKYSATGGACCDAQSNFGAGQGPAGQCVVYDSV